MFERSNRWARSVVSSAASPCGIVASGGVIGSPRRTRFLEGTLGSEVGSVKELRGLGSDHAADAVRGHGLFDRSYVGHRGRAVVAVDPAGRVGGDLEVRRAAAGSRDLAEGAHRAAEMAGRAWRTR